jgi:hypothetical protein
MKRIVCVGNNTENTACKAEQIALQFNLPCIGLASSADVTDGVWYTDLGTISTEQFLLLGEQSDRLIMLDQPIDSYEHPETYHHTTGCCNRLTRLTHVTFENQNQDIYITTNYIPPNMFNTEVHRVKDNLQVLEILKTIDVLGRRVFIEFTQVSDIDKFDSILHAVLKYAPMANFVIFRASKHEAEEIHRAVTAKLCQHREFVILTPKVFNAHFAKNLQSILENHWQWVYGPKRLDYYYTAYAQL